MPDPEKPVRTEGASDPPTAFSRGPDTLPPKSKRPAPFPLRSIRHLLWIALFCLGGLTWVYLGMILPRLDESRLAPEISLAILLVLVFMLALTIAIWTMAKYLARRP